MIISKSKAEKVWHETYCIRCFGSMKQEDGNKCGVTSFQQIGGDNFFEFLNKLGIEVIE